MIATKTLEFKTRGKSDMIDITKEIEKFIGSCKISSGIVNVFAVGSTGAITTIEYEPGLKKDLPDCLEKIAPISQENRMNVMRNTEDVAAAGPGTKACLNDTVVPAGLFDSFRQIDKPNVLQWSAKEATNIIYAHLH